MPKSLIVALLLAVPGVCIFAPSSTAQRGGGSSGFGHSVGVSFAGRSPSHSFGRGSIFLGDPFYADYPLAPLTIPPQYVVVPPATPADAPPEAKSEPLMIELQGSRYVRFGGRQQDATPDYAEGGNSLQLTQHPAQAELPPAVLIFRDGHREQVPEYAIFGGTLYASGNYWQTGQWTKNIQLSDLNIPATLRANREKGITFILPSAPNEVVTRP
jgi:hypothetical protein